MSVETEGRLGPTDHVVQFYGDDHDVTSAAGRYLADAVRDGGVAVVIATDTHRQAFEGEMTAAGVDPATARHNGSLVTLDAHAMLLQIMNGAAPVEHDFDVVLGQHMREVCQAGRRVSAYGELVGLLWDGGHLNAAMELEEWWNQLAHEVPFSLYCGYRMPSVSGSVRLDAFNGICTLHSSVIGPRPVLELTQRFHDGLTAPRAARRFLIDTLTGWGLTSAVSDAALVVSELVSNAVLHTRSASDVTLTARGGSLTITVRDASPLLPELQYPQEGETTGRGLALVAAVARHWGVENLPSGGKTVWAELGTER